MKTKGEHRSSSTGHTGHAGWQMKCPHRQALVNLWTHRVFLPTQMPRQNVTERASPNTKHSTKVIRIRSPSTKGIRSLRRKKERNRIQAALRWFQSRRHMIAQTPAWGPRYDTKNGTLKGCCTLPANGFQDLRILLSRVIRHSRNQFFWKTLPTVSTAMADRAARDGSASSRSGVRWGRT